MIELRGAVDQRLFPDLEKTAARCRAAALLLGHGVYVQHIPLWRAAVSSTP